MKDPVPLSDSDAALQPFLQAARESALSNISSLRALVSKLLSHADIFAGYNEIKDILTPALQQGGPEGTKLMNTLDLFSYGTYTDYVTLIEDPQQQQQQQFYMTLTDSQIFKLRQLTVLTLAQTSTTDCLSYQHIQRALQLPPPPQTTTTQDDNSSSSIHRAALEQILISCLYSGVLTGRLCQKSQSLRLTAPVQSRDVSPTQALPELLAAVRQLQARVGQAQSALTARELTVQQHLRQDAHFWKQREQQVLSSLEQKNNQKKKWAVGGILATAAAEVTTAAAAMDVTGRRQKRSRGGLSSSGAGGASAFQV